MSDNTFLMTCAANYIRQAIAELRGLDQHLSDTAPLVPGVLRFRPSLGRQEFLARAQAREPVFVRHLQPVDTETGLTGDWADLEAIAAATEPLLSGHLAPGESVAVQVRRLSGSAPYTRFGVKERLDPILAAAGGQTVTQGAAAILSVTLTAERAYLGLSTPAENLSDWPGGEVRYRREEDQLSRAKFKLLEAFEKFQVPVPDGGAALDLGAAPGGWTSLLLERGLQVTAVDTGELGEAVRHHCALTYLKQNVEEVDFPDGTFDLLTCDLSWNPLNTARMVARLAHTLTPGAHAVLTVKLMLANPTRTIRQVGEALGGQFRVLAVKQLYHNRDEVTMHLQRCSPLR